MRIIISPAKKMNIDKDSLVFMDLPVFIQETEKIRNWLQSRSFEQLKKLWGCNESIAKLNFERLQNMELYRNLTPAILSYEGIQYQYMAPAVFEEQMLGYVQEHLRILSGFYGVVKPMDGVTPYRLEMQAKANINGLADLYEFWGRRLYEEVIDDSRVIINLASKEYSKCIEKYLKPEDHYITVVFGELSDGAEKASKKVVQKGTLAKMARGEMVRFMAEKNVKEPEGMKAFDRLGYTYFEELSSDTKYVFIKR